MSGTTITLPRVTKFNKTSPAEKTVCVNKEHIAPRDRRYRELQAEALATRDFQSE
jgi:hypothetical protein